jgi:hypothetical protein
MTFMVLMVVAEFLFCIAGVVFQWSLLCRYLRALLSDRALHDEYEGNKRNGECRKPEECVEVSGSPVVSLLISRQNNKICDRSSVKVLAQEIRQVPQLVAGRRAVDQARRLVVTLAASECA